MQIDESAAGRSLDVAIDDVLSVRLKENPTTGYRWSVEKAGGLQWEDRGGGGGAPGGGGTREFSFRAARPGTYEICLRHWRDWEGERGIIGRFALVLNVR